MRNNKTTYDHSRSNLLIAILFTILNFALIFLETDTMFLFSATIPYYFALAGWYFESIIELVIGIVMIAVLLVFWIISKKHRIGLILSFIYFIIDTIFMLWLYDFQFDASMIIDLLFHVWIMFYLVNGILYHNRNKNKTEIEVMVDEINQDEAVKIANKSPLRLAEDVKARIFLEEEILGRHVVYRRVKTVNELVINGKVYDEYVALMEMPHSLLAEIDGHIYEAGCNSASQLYLAIDGEIIKKKLRLF